jgi:carbamoyltransferase
MIVLGISAFYHDSAAAIVRDGRILAAAQEERFSRIKNDAGFPRNAILYCLRAAGVTLDKLDYIGFYQYLRQLRKTEGWLSGMNAP